VSQTGRDLRFWFHLLAKTALISLRVARGFSKDSSNLALTKTPGIAGRFCERHFS
jgi:hypothetical protein